jgi:hypothetical protein
LPFRPSPDFFLGATVLFCENGQALCFTLHFIIAARRHAWPGGHANFEKQDGYLE